MARVELGNVFRVFLGSESALVISDHLRNQNVLFCLSHFDSGDFSLCRKNAGFSNLAE